MKIKRDVLDGIIDRNGGDAGIQIIFDDEHRNRCQPLKYMRFP